MYTLVPRVVFSAGRNANRRGCTSTGALSSAPGHGVDPEEQLPGVKFLRARMQGAQGSSVLHAAASVHADL